MKTENEIDTFIDAYNRAVDEKQKVFEFEINVEGKVSIKRIFKVRRFKIKKNTPDRIERLLKSQNKLIEKIGYPYCPCKIERSEGNICACVDFLDEIQENGECYCRMFLKL